MQLQTNPNVKGEVARRFERRQNTFAYFISVGKASVDHKLLVLRFRVTYFATYLYLMRQGL